jgi:hypothetical protein
MLSIGMVCVYMIPRRLSYNGLSKGKVGDPVAADQRNFTAKVSITLTLPKRRMIQERCQETPSGP